ncbi:DUF2188 domain-containing protein [Pseudomonas sp. OIL-1]|uniref:DUF2188 domain-containing protein n=1 Tax=Pseudomonas sp. OIL-1 TaxID=2706126 RepID=UPI0013A7663A|nr:DUF2188 domain-containing protein [Pseudomonas sp. OIL-1]QIB49972.1 DUF2188 domain-containing protein [Pseudomonas sp. OIL-1]
MDNYHVSQTDRGWELRKEGASQAARTAGTKAEVLALLPDYMEGTTGSVKIHLQNGDIEEERTYPRRADPAESPG